MWTKLPDTMFAETLIDVSKDAKLLHLAGLVMCSAHLTDGFLRLGHLHMAAASVGVAPEAAAELAAIGLWEPREGGGYYLRTYLEDNPTKEDYEKFVASRQTNGRKGGRPRKNLLGKGVGSENHVANLRENLDDNLDETYVQPTGDPTTKPVSRIPSPYPDPVPVPREDDAIASDAPAALASVRLTEPPREGGKPGMALDPKPARESCLTRAQLAEFEPWWADYPRKVERKQAEAAWKKVNPDGSRTAEIVEGTAAQRLHERESRFVPYPHRFLTNMRWRDEPPADPTTTPLRLVSDRTGRSVAALRATR